jgi:hypothetical protein
MEDLPSEAKENIEGLQKALHKRIRVLKVAADSGWPTGRRKKTPLQ